MADKKNCVNCKFCKEYTRPSFLDGKYVGTTKHFTCVNKESMRWYRDITKLITCDKWETI